MMKKCQVCDGPIVNGRCKYCGMPYRNDEVLYHLNESRSDHYRHATPNAKKIMRQQAVPAQDRKASLGRTSSKEEIRAHQQKVRQAAVERMTTVKPAAAGSLGNAHGSARNLRKNMEHGQRSVQPQGQTVQRSADIFGKSAGRSRKQSKKSSRYTLLVTLILVLAGILPGAAESIVDWYSEKQEEVTEETWTVPETEETEALEWTEENGMKTYYLKPANGEVTAGEQLETGVYEAFVENGSATVTITGFSGVRDYSISEDGGTIVLMLREGDTVCVPEGSSADCVVLDQLGSTQNS